MSTEERAKVIYWAKGIARDFYREVLAHQQAQDRGEVRLFHPRKSDEVLAAELLLELLVEKM